MYYVVYKLTNLIKCDYNNNSIANILENPIHSLQIKANSNIFFPLDLLNFLFLF